MDAKELKRLFGEVAIENGFDLQFGGWFCDSSECIVVLDLQHSNFGPCYQLNIQIFVRGLFAAHEGRIKKMVKGMTPDVSLGQPTAKVAAMALDRPLSVEERRADIERLFHDFIVPIANQGSTRAGLLALAAKGQIFLLPAVRARLESKI